MRLKLLLSLVAVAAAVPCAFLLSFGLGVEEHEAHLMSYTGVWSVAAGLFTFALQSLGKGVQDARAIRPSLAAAIGIAAYLAATLCASAFRAIHLGSLQAGWGVLELGLFMLWYPMAFGALIGLVASSALKQATNRTVEAGHSGEAPSRPAADVQLAPAASDVPPSASPHLER